MFKGFKQSEQDANFKLCKAQEANNTVCVKSLWIHRHAAYDVALMGSVEVSIQPTQPQPSKATDQISKGPRYELKGT